VVTAGPGRMGCCTGLAREVEVRVDCDHSNPKVGGWLW
jgi:hypothetical protein